MTTTEHLYLAKGFRVIPAWEGYMMSPGLQVWSMARDVPCKGGKTRLKAAKRIKNDDHGRVTLSQESRRGRFHIYRELYPITFPDLAEAERKAARQRPQVACVKGHLLTDPINPVLARLADSIKPRIAEWGTGNRICLWCSTPPKSYPTDNMYSSAYGVGRIANYTNLPAEPKLNAESNPRVWAELEWAEHGFTIK
ncbi:hypothetical protein [Mycobacterium intracellulare]|uniref:hypothetical protein n=2 Tax=Mycobacterium intracellulare TaxID=1767 RepID=UPI000BAAECB3|nr:hypothetical protein [Mycobacterium intracellulare]ASW84800.1 hypothetical protein CKJ61_07755 [Mycobacterium intracellulare]